MPLAPETVLDPLRRVGYIKALAQLHLFLHELAVEDSHLLVTPVQHLGSDDALVRGGDDVHGVAIGVMPQDWVVQVWVDGWACFWLWRALLHPWSLRFLADPLINLGHSCVGGHNESVCFGNLLDATGVMVSKAGAHFVKGTIGVFNGKQSLPHCLIPRQLVLHLRDLLIHLINSCELLLNVCLLARALRPVLRGTHVVTLSIGRSPIWEATPFGRTHSPQGCRSSLCGTDQVLTASSASSLTVRDRTLLDNPVHRVPLVRDGTMPFHSVDLCNTQHRTPGISTQIFDLPQVLYLSALSGARS